MRKTLILAGMIVFVFAQVGAPQAMGKTEKTASFSGLHADVYEPCPPDDDDDCEPERYSHVLQARVIPVDSRYASPSDRKKRTSHHPYILGAGLEEAGGKLPDEYLEGNPAWNIRGRTIQFKKGAAALSGPVPFNQNHIIQMDWLSLKKARVWDWVTVTTTGAIVQLNGGKQLTANFDSDHRWSAALTKYPSKQCKSSEEVTDEVQFAAVFNRIVVKDAATSTVVLQFDPPGELTEIAIWNRPAVGDVTGGHEHFKEFYDLSVGGYNTLWDDRCNTASSKCDWDDVNKMCKYAAISIPPKVHMTVSKTAFCPPVVFEKN